MEIWQGVRVYDEAGFERKLRRESKQILWEETTSGTGPNAGDLVQEQLMDLIEGLPLPRRSRDVLHLRIQGYTLREMAVQMGVSRQRVERIWQRLQSRLPARLTEMEGQMVPGKVPHYGWQEVYLDSARIQRMKRTPEAPRE